MPYKPVPPEKRKSQKILPGQVCAGEPGCDRPVKANGLCMLHYKRRRRHAANPGARKLQKILPGQQCAQEPGCDRPVRGIGLCSMHYNRRFNLKRFYGITQADYDAMLAAQGGRCAICGTTKPGGHGKRFHVDHDEATGKVRGLLCHLCNTSIGGLRHDAALLLKAVDYLSSPPAIMAGILRRI